MKKLKNMLIAVIAITGISVSAHSFEGFSLGVVGSQADFDTSGSEREAEGDKNTATKSSSSDFASVFAEYTFAQGSTFGLEYIPGAATLGTTSRVDSAANTDDTGTRTAKAEVSDHITFYAEPTLMMSDIFGVYVKGGASKVSVNSQESGLPNSTYGNVDVWGVAYGVGAKAYHNNWFVKLEHMKTEYGTVTLHSTNTDVGNVITADIDQTATRMAIGYNF